MLREIAVADSRGRLGNDETMIKSSKAVVLMLIGSIAVLWGFKSCLNARHDYDEFGYFDEDGADGTPTTGPTSQSLTGSSGSGSHYSRTRASHWFWGPSRYRGSSWSSSGRSSSGGSSGGSRSSSVHSSGTSRGGFGGSGHAAHS
jgi:hypothetical protein